MVPILDYLLIAFSQPTAIIKVWSINTILHFVILNVVNEREESEEKKCVSVWGCKTVAEKLWGRFRDANFSRGCGTKWAAHVHRRHPLAVTDLTMSRTFGSDSQLCWQQFSSDRDLDWKIGKFTPPATRMGWKFILFIWVFFYAHQNPPKCKKARIWDQANYIVPESSLHLPPIGPTLDPNTSKAPSNTQHWNAYCSLSLCFWVTLWLERVLFERLGFVWYWTHDCWHVHLNPISQQLFTLTSEFIRLGVNKHCPSLPFSSSRQQLITSCRR